MFWTVQHPVGPVTLCDRCALAAINMASFSSPVQTLFRSVEEFLVQVNAMAAMNGIDDLEMESSKFGACGNCGDQVI